MSAHFKQVCKCGIMIAQCRCPGQKAVRVTETCDHKWAQELENELSEEYDIPANVCGKNVKYVEVELPATRQMLNVESSNLYGFVLSLVVFDESGGVLKEMNYATCVKQSDLADTIANIYNSY